MDENIRIFEEQYTVDQLEPSTAHRYDRQMVALRRDLLGRHVRGRALDLCCGTGAYSVTPSASTIGLDGSAQMLTEHRARSGGDAILTQGDARSLPFSTSSFDSVYALTALYLVPDLPRAMEEIRRVLRPGGVAVLELGNRRSLNTLIVRRHHVRSGWAQTHALPLGTLRRLIAAIGTVVEWHSFQVLPMLRPGPGQWWLLPMAHPAWKSPLSAGSDGRMLDEHLSSTRALRGVAFRHLVVVRRS